MATVAPGGGVFESSEAASPGEDASGLSGAGVLSDAGAFWSAPASAVGEGDASAELSLGGVSAVFAPAAARCTIEQAHIATAALKASINVSARASEHATPPDLMTERRTIYWLNSMGWPQA